jgi:hypothetical protein
MKMVPHFWLLISSHTYEVVLDAFSEKRPVRVARAAGPSSTLVRIALNTNNRGKNVKAQEVTQRVRP